MIIEIKNEQLYQWGAFKEEHPELQGKFINIINGKEWMIFTGKWDDLTDRQRATSTTFGRPYYVEKEKVIKVKNKYLCLGAKTICADHLNEECDEYPDLNGYCVKHRKIVWITMWDILGKLVDDDTRREINRLNLHTLACKHKTIEALRERGINNGWR